MSYCLSSAGALVIILSIKVCALVSQLSVTACDYQGGRITLSSRVGGVGLIAGGAFLYFMAA
jgi:hypothetical protein